jgi:hypothetical protein
MYSTLNDTLPSASSPGEPITARSVRGVAAAAAKASSAAPYTWMDGLKLLSTGITVARTLGPVIKNVAPIVGLMRLGFGGPLAWLGLSRRRGPLATLSLFGAGVAVGAGAGLLFAPSSGEKLRRALIDGVNRDAEPKRASDGADERGTRIAPWISPSTASIQDSPQAKVDVNAATTPAGPPDHEHAAMVDSEVAKPTRAAGAAGYRFG